MRDTEKQFIELLSKYFKGDNKVTVYPYVDWKYLINLAKSHKVEGIIYLEIITSNLKSKFNEEELKTLKKVTICSAACQIRNIDNLEEIFQKFNDKNIPVIGLKGIVLRNLYPIPELRTMSDVDILVHKSELDKVTSILTNIGYVLQNNEDKHHFRFTHKIYPVIEAHWFITERNDMEEAMWNSAIKTKVLTTDILTLDYEDFLLQLSLHMKDHILALGFGIRQICDYYIFVEENRNKIDFSSFIKKAKDLNIDKFVLSIFAVCNKLFFMKIPRELERREVLESEQIDLLIKDILEGGVYGRNNPVRMLGASISLNLQKNSSNSFVSMTRKIRSVLFPNSELFTGKYEYAKKFKILTPVAGVQYLYDSRFHRDNGFINNIKELKGGIKISKSKNNLIKWLEI